MADALSASIFIGETVSGGTSGSILYIDANGKAAQNNASLFWDNTALQLKLLGTANPQLNLLYDSTHNATFQVASTGLLTIGGTGASGGAVTINQWLNVGSTTDAAAQGDFSAGLTGAARLSWTQSTNELDVIGNGAVFRVRNVSGGINLLNANIGTGSYEIGGFAMPFANQGALGAGGTEVIRLLTTGAGVFTTTPRRRLDILDTASPQLRLTYTDNAIYADLQTNSTGDLLITTVGGTGDNLGIFGSSFGGSKGAIFLLNAITNPTSNPTGGGIMYANGGAGTWRGSGGTVTAFGPAGPHCGNCGYDFWRVASHNELWGASLRECGWCGKVYKSGPKSVLHLLTDDQKRELISC